MSSAEAINRRQAFISDLVEVCKKHRVMMDPDGSEWDGLDFSEISFTEFDDSKDLCFFVGISQIEDAVRQAVWPLVHNVDETDVKIDYASEFMIDDN